MFTENQLVKQIIRTYTPATSGFPGSPGTPYQPAYYRTETVENCYWVSNNYQTTEQDTSGRRSVGTNSASARYRRVCSKTEVTTYVPEQPARPAIAPIPASAEQTIIDYQFGWNAKARSVVPMQGNGSFRFRVPKSTSGAVVGLSAAPQETGYSDITFGFYVSSGVVSIYESGVEVANLGAHPDATLTITRNDGRILYDIDGTVVRDRSNTAAPVFLTAGLYLGGDSVEDAELLGISSAHGYMLPMAGYAGESLVNQAIGYFAAMSGECGSYNAGGASGSFPVMTGVAADAGGYSMSSGSFKPMTGYAEQSGVIPTYAFSDGFMMPLTGTAQGVHHIIGESSGSFLPAVGISSDVEYSFAQGFMSNMTGYADEGERTDQAFLFSGFDSGFSITPLSMHFAVVDGRMNVVGMFTVSSVNVAEVMAQFGVSDTFALSQVIQAAIESWMDANAVTLDNAQSRDVWVYHMDVGGSTRYEGYDFTSIKKVGDAYYGVKPDGIYLLEGSTDGDSTGPAASIHFGSLNFGTMNRKALPYVYVGMASNGDTFLRVTASTLNSSNRPVNSTYTYRVRDKTEDMKSHRFELGRGLSSSFYELELVADGTAFDLHNIEFQPASLSRRL